MFASKMEGFIQSPTNSQKAARPLAPFSPPSLHVNVGDLGLFLGKQYIIPLVGLVKGKKGYCQPVVSNRSSGVQKLFSVIRDGSRNSMYKISLKISYKQCKETNKKHNWLEYVKHQPCSPGPILSTAQYMITVLLKHM
jgi:hypothetical protein